jgi:hypothetical protein
MNYFNRLWGFGLIREGGGREDLSIYHPSVQDRTKNPQKTNHTHPSLFGQIGQIGQNSVARPRPKGGSCVALRFEVPYAAVVARVAKPDDTGTIKVLFGLGHE